MEQTEALDEIQIKIHNFDSFEKKVISEKK
jgi:hypothetical protein